MEEGICQECQQWGWQEVHHIVFKSQGGLDFPLNFKKLGSHLSCNCHRSSTGPHFSVKKDLEYKRELQDELRKVLTQEYYTIHELTKVLGTIPEQVKRAFKTLHIYAEGYLMEDVVKRLMGGRLY